jgi:transposase
LATQSSTQILNALRGHLAEMGVIAPQGKQNSYALKRLVFEGADENGEVVVLDCVRVALAPLGRQIDALDDAITAIDKQIATQTKGDLVESPEPAGASLQGRETD